MFRQRLLSLDPGFSSLRTALRGTFASLAAFQVLSEMAAHFSFPPALAFVSAMLAMFPALVINDQTIKERRKTSFMILIPAVCGLVTSIALARFEILRMIAFLAVTFVSIYLRRSGPRGFALGFILFVSFFMQLFFPVALKFIPAAIASVTIGIVFAAVFRLWIFPDRRNSMLRGYVDAIELKLLAVLQEIALVLERAAKRRLQKENLSVTRVRKAFGELNALIVIVDQFLKNDCGLTKREIEKVRLRLLERELSVRDTAEAARALAQNPRTTAKHVAKAVDEIRLTIQWLRGRDQFPFQEQRMGTDSLAEELSELRRALGRVIDKQPHLEELGYLITGEETVAPEPPQAKKRSGLHLSTKQAVQATLATALASLFGITVSPERWYWASFAAFIVFAGTSRGETTARALLRIIGTVSGLTFGFVLADLFSGDKNLEIGMIFVSIFIGLFYAKRDFGFWSALLFSLMLALLFDIMGKMTLELLILRLEETAVGAVIGALMSALVLPTSTRTTLRDAQVKLLSTCSSIFAELPLETKRTRILVLHLRQLDQNLLDLRTAAAPLVDVPMVLSKRFARHILFDSLALTHLVKHLATNREIAQSADYDSVRAKCQQFSERLNAVALKLKESPDFSSRIIDDFPVAAPENDETSLSHLFRRVEQVLSSIEGAKPPAALAT